MDKQKENTPPYSFLYIKKPQSHLARWNGKNPKFLEAGRMQYFASILCPVSTANVDVLERTRAEYDTIEFVILKLYASGIQTVELLSSVTGLEEEMVANVLSILENTYRHIKDGQLTPEGRESLLDRRNIQCFETTKQVQFEAITGTVLLPVLFQSMSGIEAYYYDRNAEGIRRILPKHYIERDIRTDIMENFDRHRNRGTIERNVESIIDVSVEDCKYTEAFMVKYDFLPHPIIIFPVQGSKSILWMPVAVSESTAKAMEAHNLAFTYYNFDLVVRPDRDFEPLLDIEKEYGLVVRDESLEQEFKLGEKTYKMTTPDTEGAVLKIHPSTGFTPVYCAEASEENTEEEKADVDMQM